MKRFARPFTLLLALCALAPAAHAKDDGHAKDRATIRAAYAAVDKANDNKDADATMVYMTDDFVRMDKNGGVLSATKAEELGDKKKAFARLDTLLHHTVVTNIQFTHQGATVGITFNATMTLTINGHKHIAVIKATTRDIWVKSGNGWLENRSTNLTHENTMDGQPME